MRAKPAYKEILDALNGRIARDEYKVGEKLPNEIALAAEFQVSRNTVRHALSILHDDGRIKRIKNVGTILTAKVRETRIDLNFSSTESIRKLSRQTTFDVLTRADRRIPDVFDGLLARADARGQWVCVQGVRRDRESGVALSFVDVYIRREYSGVMEGVDLSNELIFPLFGERYGVGVKAVRILMRPVGIVGPRAQHLGVDEGTSGMELFEILRTERGKVLEVVNGLYVGRYFNFAVDQAL